MQTAQSALLCVHFHATYHLLFKMTSTQVFSMWACIAAQLFVALNNISCLNVLCVSRQSRALVSQVVRVDVLTLS